MEKYNLSAEKTVKFFLYRGKINRFKDNKGVFTDNSSKEKFGSNFLQKYFSPSKNKYVISWEEINRTEIKKVSISSVTFSQEYKSSLVLIYIGGFFKDKSSFFIPAFHIP